MAQPSRTGNRRHITTRLFHHRLRRNMDCIRNTTGQYIRVIQRKAHYHPLFHHQWRNIHLFRHSQDALLAWLLMRATTTNEARETTQHPQ